MSPVLFIIFMDRISRRSQGLEGVWFGSHWIPSLLFVDDVVCSRRDRVRSSVTWEELGVAPLLLHVERSQLRWLGHLYQMPPGCLPREVFLACPTGRRPQGRPRTRWSDYVTRLDRERLRILPDELEEVSGVREVWASLLRQLPRRPGDPAPDKQKKMDGWMDVN